MNSITRPPTPFFTVTYRVTPPAPDTITRFAQSIAEEQTVEIPHEIIPDELHQSGIVGSVIDIQQIDEGTFHVVIRYRGDITGWSIPQFLNVLFGNISLKKDILITDISLPDDCISRFPGPRFGIAGIREKLGIYHRPLLCTALKPLGSSSLELARIAGEAAQGGIDMIKDDHGIADQPFHPFEERIPRVMEAIGTANLTTGDTTLYFPNLCGTLEEIDRQADFAVRHGVQGVLLSPHLAGLDSVRSIAQKYNLVIMAHPAFTGSLFTHGLQGIAPEVYLGTIFRMMGADISIYPSWGGRFPFSRETCLAIARNLTTDSIALKPAFPGPAGGITLDRFSTIAEGYGEDAVLLVGGSLLSHSSDIRKNAAHFLDTLRGFFREEKTLPVSTFASSCELPADSTESLPPPAVRTFDNFNWKDLTHQAYKEDGTSQFTGIVRTELIGRNGTNTAFDLRYFEIEPGGYSTFEKHRHEHVIIGVRGRGILLKNGRQYPIHPNDIGFVAAMEPHQLQNLTNEPFGFYCIVDHDRDRPQPVDMEDFG